MKIYFHSDLDGSCSAYWVLKHIKPRNTECIPVDYDKPFDISSVQSDESVYILDFCPPPEKMRELLGITHDVIWIDHHISSIERYKNFGYEISGVRQVGIAACLLTWGWVTDSPYVSPINPLEAVLQPDNLFDSAPDFVQLLADFDTFELQLGDASLKFAYALMAMDYTPQGSLWRLMDRFPDVVQPTLRSGHQILRYKRKYAEDILKSYSWETIFEGYECLVVNTGKVTHDFFRSIETPYDMFITTIFDGGMFDVRLYSNTVDVSEIAMRYGGGGHKRAAGFRTKMFCWGKK